MKSGGPVLRPPTPPRPGARLRRPWALIAIAVLARPPAAGGQDFAPETVRVSLEEAIEVALRESPSLTRADAGLAMAAADRLDAIGSFLPSADLGYGYQRSNTGRLDPTGQAITQQSHTLQLGANVELFDGGRRFANLRSTARGLDAEQATVRSERLETVLAVKETFFGAIAARDLLRVEEQRVARLEDQLEFVRRQLALGRATRSDELRSSVDLNNARLDRLNAQFAIREATFELATVMGVAEPVAPLEEAELETPAFPLSREEVVAMALEQGPSVVAARASADAARAAVSAARSAYWPSLSLRGGQSWRNEGFPPEDGSWSVSLQANMPLFDRLGREAAVDRSQALARIATADAREAELSLRTEVEAAYNALEAARAGIDLAAETVELAREDLRVSEERFRVRLATILDLQAAQIAFHEAEIDLIQRRFDLALAVAELEALIGRRLP